MNKKCRCGFNCLFQESVGFCMEKEPTASDGPISYTTANNQDNNRKYYQQR